MDKPDPKVISAAVDEADEEPLSWLVPLRLASLELLMANGATTGKTEDPARSPANWILPCTLAVALLITGTAAVLNGSKSPANWIFPLSTGVASGVAPPDIWAST
jgi:hypothetical protein